MATPAELLTQALAKLQTANRIDGTKNSYRKDNPNEYAAVVAYLKGGARPTGAVTDMGTGLLLAEDARRMMEVQSMAFPSRWHVSGAQILDALTSPLGLLRGINVHVHPETHTSAGFVWDQSHYDAMAARGFGIVRCTLHWDSLQPTNEATVNAAMLTDIDTAVERAGDAGMYSVLEIHFNVSRAPSWAAGYGWETDAFMGHGETVTEALADRYKDDKRVVGLTWNEIPIVPTADLLTFHQTCVPWYRALAPAWPLWIVPSAYGLGTPYPDSGLDASISDYLALDTNGVGLIAEYHHYFVESGSGSDDGYQFNGAPDPVSQVGASGSNYGGVYPATAGALADLGRHVQPWKDWEDSGSGRVVTCVGEWAYLYDGGMSGYAANNYEEFTADIIGTFREREFAIEMWWNYDTTTNEVTNPFSARPSGTWRPAVQTWMDIEVPSTASNFQLSAPRVYR